MANGQRPQWADMMEYLALRFAQNVQSIFGFVVDNRMETYQYAVSVTIPATASNYARGASNTGTISITAESDFVATAFTGVEEILTADGTPTNFIGQIVCGLLTGAGTAAAPTIQQPAVGPGLWDYLVTDGSTDRQMSNQAIHAYAGIGVGSLPYHLPKPRLFKRNSNIRIAFTVRHPRIGSAGTVETVNIQFVAHGYKVYDRSALNLTERV